MHTTHKYVHMWCVLSRCSFSYRQQTTNSRCLLSYHSHCLSGSKLFSQLFHLRKRWRNSFIDVDWQTAHLSTSTM